LDRYRPCILIAEDDAEAREILATAFAHWDYPLLAAADGQEALHLVAKRRVDVALLDMVMPGLNGLELSECLRQIDPNIIMVMMTAYASAEDAIAARDCGVVYYLTKPCLPSLVRRIVDELWAAHWCRCREWVGGVCVDWWSETVIVNGCAVPFRALTKRERDVWVELGKGKSNREIASTLGLGETTIHTYMQRLMRKFGFKSRVQAALVWQAYRRRKERKR